MTRDEMIELLDRHMHAELSADLDGLMATLGAEPVWGPPEGPNITGRDAIREHYTNTLVEGRFEARRLHTWVDLEAKSAANLYIVGVNVPDGRTIEFPVMQVVEFDENDLMKTECLYYEENKRPVDLVPPEALGYVTA